MPADNSIFPPGIYNCCIVPVGSLFHVQTCADADIRRHDRVENKWICWHQRLGYMPLATIQQMINTCQGLDDLQSIEMPRNYVSVNVKMGKETNLDQTPPNLTRAESHMRIVHFDHFGPIKQSFLQNTHTVLCLLTIINDAHVCILSKQIGRFRHV
jgi:hypothetical protein